MIMPILKHAKDFDIIHVHSYRQFQDVISFIILSLLSKRYILTSHGYVLPDGKAKFYKKIVDFIIGKKILFHAFRIIAFDEKQSHDYQEMGVKKENIRIIPNSINIENLPEKGEFKKLLNLPHDTKIVLYMGRIEKDKGISVLINAFSKIKTENLHLVVAGPDFGLLDESIELSKKLQIMDRIHFPGLLNNEEKWKAFVDANVVVYPSFHEAGIPMVILEAAASARPLVISDSIGFAKEASEYNAGLICPPKDSDKLAEKIQMLLDDLVEAEKMGLHAQQIIKKKFSLDVAIQQHLEVYNETIKND
jgi:glycosyltransferase involved in cell wall biosynthesis